MVLMKGHYRWQQDHVLRKLAQVLETWRQTANNHHPIAETPLIQFISPGESRDTLGFKAFQDSFLKGRFGT